MKTTSLIANTPTVTPDGLTIPMASILGTAGTLALGTVVWLLRRELAHHDRRLQNIEAAIEERRRKTEDLETKLLAQMDSIRNQITDLRMELPQRYVSETVYLRQYTQLQLSMDKLHERLDQALRP